MKSGNFLTKAICLSYYQHLSESAYVTPANAYALRKSAFTMYSFFLVNRKLDSFSLFAEIF